MFSLRKLAFLSALVLTPALAFGQSPTLFHGSALYRLDAPSHHTAGCFPPCLCPIAFHDDLLGTYELRYTNSAPNWTDHYEVQSVNWILRRGGADVRVTGYGHYERSGQLVVRERMVLSLSEDGETPRRFDSGYQPAGALPRIALDLSLNGMVCYDEVYSIDSKPVPASQFIPYGLRSSQYLEGCFGVCLCVLQTWPVKGSFSLVPLTLVTSATSHRDYALVRIGWNTAPTLSPAQFPPPPAHAWRGFGTYSIDPMAGTHRLVVDLVEAGVERRFDSREVPGGSAFPRISAQISEGDMSCFDRVFRLHALPR